MVRILTIVLCFAIVIGCQSDVNAQPKLVMQDSVDWGVVSPGNDPDEVASVSAEVKLKNDGDAILHIKEVRPSCGCTSAPLDKDSLLPGEETIMRIKLNLPTHNGPLHKKITVSSDDPLEPNKVLDLKADVQRALQLSSSFIPFNKGKVGMQVTGEIVISNKGQSPVNVNARSLDPSYIIVSANPFIIGPGEEKPLTVTYTPQKQGTFRFQMNIETDLKGYEKFVVHGYGSADP